MNGRVGPVQVEDGPADGFGLSGDIGEQEFPKMVRADQGVEVAGGNDVGHIGPEHVPMDDAGAFRENAIIEC